MKKKHLPISGYITLIIILLLFIEAGWLYSLYRAEKRDFRYIIIHSIEDAIKEEILTCPIQNPNGSNDLHLKERLIMTYTYKGKYFQIDTNKKLFPIFHNRKLYDFNKENWNIDSLAAWFRHFCPWENLNLVFIRQDPAGKIIDRYPASSRKPHREPDFAPFQLGNLEADTLTAWFDFPFNRFWLRQRYGLLLSIVPLLFALSFGFIILRRERNRKRDYLLTEKQLIFLHDLKTPLCTGFHIEQRILQYADVWPAEKIRQKSDGIRHLFSHIDNEMMQLLVCSTGRWGIDTKTSEFNLRHLLEEITARYGCASEFSRIVLDYRLNTSIVRGDSFHLSHIISNLIDNALRHAGPDTTITITCTTDRRGRTRLSIEDNGPGIPCRLRRKIFRPGFHSGQQNESHGIGLAYVRNAVRRIGARLRLDSRQGHGSRFILTFIPRKKRRLQTLHTSPRFHYCFVAAITIAILFWTGNLYIVDRRAFATEELQYINEAVFQNNTELFKWRQDTNCFRNNFEAETITVTHNGKDTTLSMGTHVNQSYIYRRLFYDLCDTAWCINNLSATYRRLSANRLPTIFWHLDAIGRTINRTPTKHRELFLPAECSLPLGFVEGHHLKVQLAYPWLRLIHRYGFALFLALTGLSLTAWFSRIISAQILKQETFVRFQRQEVQLFIRNLQPRFRQIRNPQTTNPQALSKVVNRNLQIYKELLEQINLLLEKFKTLK